MGNPGQAFLRRRLGRRFCWSGTGICVAKSFARGILGRLCLGVWPGLLTSSAECLVSIPGLCPGLWKDYDYAMGARVGYAACFWYSIIFGSSFACISCYGRSRFSAPKKFGIWLRALIYVFECCLLAGASKEAFLWSAVHAVSRVSLPVGGRSYSAKFRLSQVSLVLEALTSVCR